MSAARICTDYRRGSEFVSADEVEKLKTLLYTTVGNSSKQAVAYEYSVK